MCACVEHGLKIQLSHNSVVWKQDPSPFIILSHLEMPFLRSSHWHTQRVLPFLWGVAGCIQVVSWVGFTRCWKLGKFIWFQDLFLKLRWCTWECLAVFGGWQAPSYLASLRSMILSVTSRWSRARAVPVLRLRRSQHFSNTYSVVQHVPWAFCAWPHWDFRIRTIHGKQYLILQWGIWGSGYNLLGHITDQS